MLTGRKLLISQRGWDRHCICLNNRTLHTPKLHNHCWLIVGNTVLRPCRLSCSGPAQSPWRTGRTPGGEEGLCWLIVGNTVLRPCRLSCSGPAQSPWRTGRTPGGEEGLCWLIVGNTVLRPCRLSCSGPALSPWRTGRTPGEEEGLCWLIVGNLTPVLSHISPATLTTIFKKHHIPVITPSRAFDVNFQTSSILVLLVSNFANTK